MTREVRIPLSWWLIVRYLSFDNWDSRRWESVTPVAASCMTEALCCSIWCYCLPCWYLNCLLLTEVRSPRAILLFSSCVMFTPGHLWHPTAREDLFLSTIDIAFSIMYIFASVLVPFSPKPRYTFSIWCKTLCLFISLTSFTLDAKWFPWGRLTYYCDSAWFEP